MVTSLGPGKFYGSSLPRPRFYTDVKLNDERVDPPPPLLDPFTSWSVKAHWSMGGLSHKRLRLQGRIEGNVKRLRAEREEFQMKKSQLADSPSPIVKKSIGDSSKIINMSSSPPPAPIANKRRRCRFMIEEDDDEDIEKRMLVRNLDDEFDQVASDEIENVEEDVKEKKSVRVTRSSCSSPVTRTRSSSRLAKRG